MEEISEQFQIANKYLVEGKLEEAEELFSRIIKAHPDFSDAHNKLGIVLKDCGKLEEAIRFHERAVFLRPDFVEAHYKLSIALRDASRLDDAVASCKRVLELDPENSPAIHMLSALTGNTTGRAPADYVTHLFNNFSKRFDCHSEGNGYRVPLILRELLNKHVDKEFFFENAIDLGCGTGISGSAIASITKRLSGVDLSENMIQEARGKGDYEKLYVDSVEKFLESDMEQYDLFMCTDVFIYIGDLTPVFNLVRERALTKAIFAFSVEDVDGPGPNYVLRKSGRYAQSALYIESLATANTFKIIDKQTEILREDKGEPIQGSLYILQYEN